MNLTFDLDVSRLREKMGRLIKAAKNTPKILRILGSEVRADSAERFAAEGPGWAPLADSTIKRLQHTRTSRVTVQGTVRKSYAVRAAAGLHVAAKKGKVSFTAIDELRRLVSGGSLGFTLEREGRLSVRNVEKDGQVHQVIEGRKGSRAIAALRRELAAHEDKNDFERRAGKRAIDNHRLLGKLSGANRLQPEGARAIRVTNTVPWSKVHNEGGPAGKGAEEPERRFLAITDQALSRGVERVEQYLYEETER